MILRTADVAEMSDFAVRANAADLPEQVGRFGRLLFLDTLGVMVGGLRYPEVRAMGRDLGGAGGQAEDEVLPLVRLLALGSAATWLDADSGGSENPLARRIPPVPTAHPCPHSMPILLHEAASRNVDDVTIFGAFTIANELAMRFSVASNLRPGVHPHGVHGPIASALATALIQEFSSEQVFETILLSSCLPMAATLRTPMRGGTVRNLWTGLAAYYGAAASQWAKAGFRGSVDAYLGLFDGAVAEDFDASSLTEALGTRWQLLSSYLKPYACARWVHSSLDAVGIIMRREGLAADDVDSIQIDTYEFASMLDAVDIQSDLHARFSIPYSVATFVIDGELHAPGFLKAARSRETVSNLAKRVFIREDQNYTAALPEERPTKATIYTKRGVTHALEVRRPRGNPESALETDEVVAKFRSNVGEILPVGLADDVVSATLGRGDQRKGYSVAAVATALFDRLGI